NSFYLEFHSVNTQPDSLHGLISIAPNQKGRGYVYSHRNKVKFNIYVDLNGESKIDGSPEPIRPGDPL
ncbi:MAG: hypothetical protein ABIA63_00395, partial [bacterium]